MTIAAMNNAVKLVRELDSMIPHVEGMSLRVSNFLREHDYVEGVGSHEVESIVYFDPLCGKGPRILAKVLASYGTWDGKVFYDIALSYSEGKTFAESVPLRDVVPSMIRSIDDVESNGVSFKDGAVQVRVEPVGDCQLDPTSVNEVAPQSA